MVLCTLAVLSCGPGEAIPQKPLVEQIIPAQAKVGDRITVSGLNFGIGGPRDGVFVAGESQPVEVWSNTSIVVLLETEHLGHGLLVVRTDDQVSDPVPIEILKMGVEPTSAIEIHD